MPIQLGDADRAPSLWQGVRVEPSEGVVKFEPDHETRELSVERFGALACELEAWRVILSHTGLVGQELARYGGAAYGNVSGRVGPRALERGRRAFLITGTQTGGKSHLTLADFALVEAYDLRANRVTSFGLNLPSSESLTHGAVYDLAPTVRTVLHAHAAALWQLREELRLPTTDPGVAYGTPEMAREVQRLYRSTNLSDSRIFAMAGHEDGIVVFGATHHEAGATLMTYLARAYALHCQNGRCWANRAGQHGSDVEA